jgi:hypothetical protein
MQGIKILHLIILFFVLYRINFQAHLNLATTLGDSLVDGPHTRHSETAEHLPVGCGSQLSEAA